MSHLVGRAGWWVVAGTWLGCASESLLPERVDTVAPRAENGRVVARFHAELSPKRGQLELFRIHPGDVITRHAPMATAVNYDYAAGGVATDESCDAYGTDPLLPACSGLSNVVNLYTDQDDVTYVEAGVCYNNGNAITGAAAATCNGKYPLGHVCLGERVFCGPIRIASFFAAGRGIQNPILDIGELGNEAAIDGCRDSGATMGTCESASPEKITAGTSDFVPALAGEGSELACAYCYGNFAATTTLTGLRHVLIPGVSATLVDAYTNTVALKIDDDFDTNNFVETTLTLYEALPAFESTAGQQIRYVDASGNDLPTQCWSTDGRFQLEGASFGPRAECLSAGASPTTCDTATGNNFTGYSLSYSGALTATDNAEAWNDTTARTPSLTTDIEPYGCTVTLTTPAGTATTSDQLTLCSDQWRDWTPTTFTTNVNGAGGVIGNSLFLFGGRTNPHQPGSGTTTLQTMPLPRCSAPMPNLTTVSSTPPTGIGRWGQAYAVGSGGLYVMGGADAAGTGCSNVAAVVDASGAWTTLTAMPIAVCQASAARISDLGNGRELIVVVGGVTGAPHTIAGTGTMNTGTLIYDVAANSWATSTIGLARYNMGSAGSGNFGYFVAGGNNTANNNVVGTVSRVAVTNGTTVQALSSGSIGTGVSLPAVVVNGGFLYAFGGRSSTLIANGTPPSASSAARRTTLALGAWTTLTSMNAPIWGAVAVNADFDETAPLTDLNRPLVLYGGGNGNSTQTRIQEYVP